MSELVITPKIKDPDGFYADLIAVHDGLSDDESADLNARLILILANQVADRAVLAQALAAARSSSHPGDLA